MTSLLDIVGALLRDPIVKAEYLAAPDDFLSRRGFPDLEPDEIQEVLVHVAEASPPALALHIDADAGLDGAASLDVAELDQPFGVEFDGDLPLLPHDPIDDLDTVDLFDAPTEPAAVAPERLEQSEESGEPAEPDAHAASVGPDDGEGHGNQHTDSDLEPDELDALSEESGLDVIEDDLYPMGVTPGADFSATEDFSVDDLYEDDILDDVGEFDDPAGFGD